MNDIRELNIPISHGISIAEVFNGQFLMIEASLKPLSKRELHMESLSSSKERRKYERYSINLPLNFKVKENTSLCTGLSINASETGILIQTLTNMTIGTRIYLEVLFAKGFELSTLQGMADIIWKDDYAWDNFKGYKYGLKFVQISIENHTKLKLLLGSCFNLEQ